MPQIKVCGITDPAFATEAARMGVDYLGFIFVKASPRCVTAGQAKEIMKKVRRVEDDTPHHVRAVGVFRGETVSKILEIAAEVPLEVVQLHENRDAEKIAALKAEGYEVWQLHTTADSTAFNPDFESLKEDAALIDGYAGGQCGGTGQTADWSRVTAMKRTGHRIVLAGGLSPNNISAAAATGADVLDVNSSLETSPGVKSVPLLQRLMREFTQGSSH